MIWVPRIRFWERISATMLRTTIARLGGLSIFYQGSCRGGAQPEKRAPPGMVPAGPRTAKQLQGEQLFLKEQRVSP